MRVRRKQNNNNKTGIRKECCSNEIKPQALYEANLTGLPGSEGFPFAEQCNFY
ncbi:hypothetical protein NCCP133_15550 [Cytobacillus sp. NCCP-133]|nr:hypothetical protein NCCP133_15550 [Cytobacillus sp. NCCP-133]